VTASNSEKNITTIIGEA